MSAHLLMLLVCDTLRFSVRVVLIDRLPHFPESQCPRTHWSEITCPNSAALVKAGSADKDKVCFERIEGLYR